MNRDFDYENNNIAYDWQYTEVDGGGIKCKNYIICETVLPKWWYECKGCYLSRYLVCLIIPLNALYCIITRQAYYFNRNNIKNQIGDIMDTVCNQWEKIAILYPEGTRNTTKKVIPLKYGAIKQIYLCNLPLQIMNISNKDKVINEKQLNVNYGIVCNVIITEQIDPSKFETLDAFIEEITKKWIENFQ